MIRTSFFHFHSQFQSMGFSWTKFLRDECRWGVRPNEWVGSWGPESSEFRGHFGSLRDKVITGSAGVNPVFLASEKWRSFMGWLTESSLTLRLEDSAGTDHMEASLRCFSWAMAVCRLLCLGESLAFHLQHSLPARIESLWAKRKMTLYVKGARSQRGKDQAE